jgi:hypothetical protein
VSKRLRAQASAPESPGHKDGESNAAQAAPANQENSGKLERRRLASARRGVLQYFACAGFAGAATSRYAESVFQFLQVGNAQFGGLAYFPLGNRIT